MVGGRSAVTMRASTTQAEALDDRAVAVDVDLLQVVEEATALAEGSGRVPWGVAAYLTAVALVSLGCFALLPETRPVAVVRGPAVDRVTG